MEFYMDSISWQSQLRKGAAELVVLSVLRGEEYYGLAILERAGGSGGVLSDGTLYPLLTRLERDGKIRGRWSFDEGVKSPRKYYQLTEQGAALACEMRDIWREFSAFVSGVVEGAADVRTFQRSKDFSSTPR